MCTMPYGAPSSCLFCPTKILETLLLCIPSSKWKVLMNVCLSFLSSARSDVGAFLFLSRQASKYSFVVCAVDSNLLPLFCAEPPAQYQFVPAHPFRATLRLLEVQSAPWVDPGVRNDVCVRLCSPASRWALLLSIAQGLGSA